MTNTSIELQGVAVQFPIYNAYGRSLKRSLVHMTTGGRIGLSANDRVVVKALSNINLKLEHGDRLGLLGHNGAGKTTLLRVLGGAYAPTEGRITRIGRTSSLFDLMLGMDPESTGRENILIRGRMLGLNKAEIAARAPGIAEFCELGDYLDMPMRTYSAGMTVRLAFAISTSINPEILLMDEWLSAGDASFIEKAESRMKHLVGQTGILVLASHSLDLLRNICNKGLLLEHGEIKFFGEINEAIDTYLHPKQ
jgi:lipopolysaccharide transport system ATP-binding protein